MKYLLTFLLIVSFAIPSFGQDRALVKYKGKEGYWFSLEIGDKLLNDVIELKNVKLQNVELEGKLKIKDEKISLKSLEATNEKLIGEHWKEAFTEENKLRMKEADLYEKKLKDKTPWYKKPGVVFMGGTLVGALLAVGVAFGINWAVDKEF